MYLNTVIFSFFEIETVNQADNNKKREMIQTQIENLKVSLISKNKRDKKNDLDTDLNFVDII